MLNAAALAKKLMSDGYELVSGGTDNHLVLVDLKKSAVRKRDRPTVQYSTGSAQTNGKLPISLYGIERCDLERSGDCLVSRCLVRLNSDEVRAFLSTCRSNVRLHRCRRVSVEHRRGSRGADPGNR